MAKFIRTPSSGNRHGQEGSNRLAVPLHREPLVMIANAVEDVRRGRERISIPYRRGMVLAIYVRQVLELTEGEDDE